MYAIYEEAGKYASGKILSTTDTSAQIELDSGKRIKVKSAQLLLQFEAPAPALLWTQAQEARATMETELAYEFAQDDEFDFIQLAKDYFSSDASLAQKLASLLLLFEAPHYFRRLGKGRFKKAAPEVVALALAAIEKKRLLQAQTDQWAQDLAAGLCPDPIRAQLYKILFKPDKNAAEYKAVVQASHAAQKPPLVLLQAARAIGSAYEFHWQRFLFDQFPKGVQFSPSVLGFTPSAASLESLPLATAPQGPGGEDREVHAFSIDDSMTTEIDDALSVSGLGSGVVTLGIHIAAPALGFKPGDVMDQNARDRLSTVYMPGQKITMLPKTTVDAFTLKAGQRCASVSLYVTLSEESLETLKTFTRVEQVFIAANLRYDRLEKWINTAWLEASEPPDSPEVELNPPHELLPIEHAHAKLSFLYRLALKLKAAREVVRGKPERFNQPDYQFKLEGGTSSDDANAALSDPATPRGDERVSITPRVRGSGLDLIVAESMILANSTWGGWLSELGVPGIYRSQQSMLPGVKVRMGTKALPHAGIGVPSYAWSTSPLRRYTDLVNQWQIVACATHGNTAALAAPFKPKDTELFAIISSFESAYSAYNSHQQSMERYWVLQYILQEGITETVASVIKAVPGFPVLVRLENLPLVLSLTTAKTLNRGERVGLKLDGIDLIALDVKAQYLFTLESTAVREGAGLDLSGNPLESTEGGGNSKGEGEGLESDMDDTEELATLAGPLSLALDMEEAESSPETLSTATPVSSSESPATQG